MNQTNMYPPVQLSSTIIEQVRAETEKLLQDSRGSHDLDHTLRVYNLCLHIGSVEGADEGILKLAALLHDIGRHSQDATNGEVCHAETGARMAKELLDNLKVPQSVTGKVVHCIRTHRFRGSAIPETLEARVLYDADKLDAIGAVGIGRAFLFAGEIGAKLHNSPGTDVISTEEYSIEDTAYREYMVKLRHIKDRMLTREGSRLAGQRHDFMHHFFQRLEKEVAGDC